MIPRYLICLFGLFALAQRADQSGDKISGTVKLDEDGFARVALPPKYLDTHLCSVGDGDDEIAVAFSATFFTVAEGKKDQTIPWACVPLDPALRK